jgi:hypothetical protein
MIDVENVNDAAALVDPVDDAIDAAKADRHVSLGTHGPRRSETMEF